MFVFNIRLARWCSGVCLPVRGCGVHPGHWGSLTISPSPGHFGVVYHGEYIDEDQNRIHCAVKSLSRKWGRGQEVPRLCCATALLSDLKQENFLLYFPI